jgi:lipid-binding SYLF domain-containing protein
MKTTNSSSASRIPHFFHASHRRRLFVASAVTCAALFVAASHADLFGLGILGPSGNDVSQKQQTIQNESTEMLQELYASNPELKNTIANAAGYATFKKTDIHLFLVASGNGYGMLVNNQTGQTTYMDVASLGGGIGLGVKDLRVVFVFTDPNVMQQFVTQGWQFGTNADANAQYNNVGVGANQSTQANVDFNDGTVQGTSSTSTSAGTGNDNSGAQNLAAGSGMQIYQFTQSGVALQATVSGTKYWVDSELNN